MNTTEMGVYILGATALALLAVAGVVFGSGVALGAAVWAAGAAYLSQGLTYAGQHGYAQIVAFFSVGLWVIGSVAILGVF
jgi:hypothetical protein